ncbi:MAG: hypothetical protein IKW45_04750 [Clostridia bacterium]|nr:hypothetical protein [Clostridia bacterium]
MNHILVLPAEFETTLNTAYQNVDIHNKWLEIGVDTIEDMMNKIISQLNETNPKLCISNWRTENKNTIKEKVGNRGNTSVYAGYFEKENGNIDGLFFYIPPSLNSGNDFLTRQVIPTLIGIYEGIAQDMADMHFNNRPVYIMNINETNRSEQRAVKISFLCSELLGFKYLDIFSRNYHDVINTDETQGCLNELNTFNQLFSINGTNELFFIDNETKRLKLLSDRVTNSTNPSAEMYRYCLKVLPAIYMAFNEGYKIDMDEFNNVQINMVDVIKTYIAKMQ